jgi:large subunit ribosomal protein L31
MAKAGIHPTYYNEAVIVCSCGHSFTTGSTVKSIRTDICSNCHPFYTGEQRIVDTAGQVDRFMKRLQAGRQIRTRKTSPKKDRKPMIQTLDEA